MVGDWAKELGDEMPVTSPHQADTLLPLVPAPRAIFELINSPALPPDGRQSLRFLYATGIHDSELTGATLQPGLLLLANGRIVPLDSRTASAPLPSATVEQLQQWVLLAAGQTGLLTRFQSCGRIPRPSLLRHAYAIHSLENGMDIFALCRLLGHDALVTTEMYLDSAMADCLGPYRRYHPLLSPRTPTADVSVEDVLALCDAPERPRERVALRTLYATALRESELLNLAPGDLDPAGQRLFVRQGKGPKDRYAVIDPNTMELLTGLLPDGNLLFPWSRMWLWKIVSRAAKKTRLDQKYPNLRISPHTIRHAYATHCYRNGMDLATLGKLLGHPVLGDTVLYIHSSWDKTLDDFEHTTGGKSPFTAKSPGL